MSIVDNPSEGIAEKDRQFRNSVTNRQVRICSSAEEINWIRKSISYDTVHAHAPPPQSPPGAPKKSARNLKIFPFLWRTCSKQKAKSISVSRIPIGSDPGRTSLQTDASRGVHKSPTFVRKAKYGMQLNWTHPPIFSVGKKSFRLPAHWVERTQSSGRSRGHGTSQGVRQTYSSCPARCSSTSIV